MLRHYRSLQRLAKNADCAGMAVVATAVLACAAYLAIAAVVIHFVVKFW